MDPFRTFRALALSGAAALLLATAGTVPAYADPAPAGSAAPVAEPALVAAPENAAVTAAAQKLYEQLRAGALDRKTLEPGLSNAITPALETTIAAQFGTLGDAKWQYTGYRESPSGRVHVYRLSYSQVTLQMRFGLDKNGLVRALLFEPVKAP
jgi:hypothetical protein